MHGLYQEVRKIREKGKLNPIRLEEIFINLKLEFPNDWLLPLEIVELVYDKNSQLKKNVINYLETLSENAEIGHLINDGIELLEKEMKRVI